MAAPSLLDAAALPVVLVPLAIALLQAAYWALASRETRVVSNGAVVCERSAT